jgi:hypothetical protein
MVMPWTLGDLLLGGNISFIKESTEPLADTSKEVNLEVNTEEN